MSVLNLVRTFLVLMLDLSQLRYFVAVATLGSVAAAARQLHVSASPLSRQVIALEDRLGLRLFDRVGRQLLLTPSGQRFLADCRLLLAHANDLERRASNEAHGQKGAVGIGHVDSAIHCGIVQQVVYQLGNAALGLRVRLQAMRTDEQFAQLVDGEIDLGLAHRAAPPELHLQSQRIHSEPFLLALPEDHPLARHRTVSLPRLTDTPFILVSRATSPIGHDLMREACRLCGLEPDIRHEVSEPTAAMALVSAGMGVALVQASLKHSRPQGLVLRPLPKHFPLKLEIHAVSRRSGEQPWRQAILTLAASAGPGPVGSETEASETTNARAANKPARALMAA